MQLSTSSFPEYDNPPVIEVVFGIQFKELKGLKVAHMGTFWEKIGKMEYPKCEEMSPLIHIVETYDQPVSKLPAGTVERVDLPPLPRLFFITKEKNHLIQLQRDRFLQNWRKLREGTEYPRYKKMFPRFLKSWELLNDFIKDLGIGQLEPDQYELTYINHISQGSGWTSLGDIEKVFPDFRCRTGDRSLPEPESVAWRRIYGFPKATGRLHVSMQQGIDKETQKAVLVLNLTARGFSKDNLDGWFNTAHEWIVKGFIDLTGIDVQKSVWKRKT
jgi:uncharacterized protein (TIGR04255 family)